MTWYAASIITVTKVLDGEQDMFPIEESVYLVEAKTREDAFRRAEELGKELEFSGKEGVRWCGRSAIVQFLGIRKLRSIYPPADQFMSIDDATPVDGAEITHNVFEVKNMEQAQLLANGKFVDVSYIDDDGGT